MNYHLDYETYSSVDLRKLGHYRYAAGEDTEILMFAIATETGEPVLWVNPGIDPLGTDNMPAVAMLMEALLDPDALIYAHNAPFEAAISEFRMFEDIGVPAPDIEKWRCTAAMARKAALPPSLEKCAEALGLNQQKDKAGSALIKKFSIPQTVGKRKGERILPSEDPAAFREFCEYCLQDVRTEQAIHQALSFFELAGPDLEAFLLYQQINHRGLPVDTHTLALAADIVGETEQDLASQFRSIVDLNHTQRAKYLEFLAPLGWTEDNLQAATVVEKLEDLSWANCPDAVVSLYLKQQLSFAAFKKIDAMLNCVCPDGRVRGTLQWYGAHTGRGSGRLVQPQNFKRPTIKETEKVYARLQAGELTTSIIREEYGNPLEVVSSCIRHFLHAEDGGTFLDADYASIEARIVAWLSGQDDVVEEYRTGADQYIRMGCRIFPVTEAEELKKKAEGEGTIVRFLGKQAVLGCGFQMGAPRFLDTCNNFGFSIPKDQVEAQMLGTGSNDYEKTENAMKTDLSELAVAAYRKKHHKIAAMWGLIEESAIAAVRNPNKRVAAGSKLYFVCRKVSSKNFLFMYLPSGRFVSYPDPKLEEGKWGGEKLTYWAQVPGKSFYGHCSTYGGKLLENATQAVAADVMGAGASEAERGGYQIATLIHDEALAYRTDPDQSVDELCELLCRLPSWADGLPIAAEGFETPFYKK
jgi:DNA polymerase bacteriophage-type